LGNPSDGPGDLSDDRLVQVRVGRRTRQQQDWPPPHRIWKVSPPDFVLLHRSPGARRSSQTAGSNAAGVLSGWRAYASAVACSSASQSAFKIAVRTNSDRRRVRAGATRSKRPASSSSTSMRSDFIDWSIYSAPRTFHCRVTSRRRRGVRIQPHESATSSRRNRPRRALPRRVVCAAGRGAGRVGGGPSGGGGSAELLGATEGQVSIPGCDGFVLDLDAVWAEVERFEAHEAGTPD